MSVHTQLYSTGIMEEIVIDFLREERNILCLVCLGNVHNGLLESFIAKWGSQSMELWKEGDSGPLYPQQGGMCERGTRHMTCLMGTLGGRTKGGPGHRFLVCG